MSSWGKFLLHLMLLTLAIHLHSLPNLNNKRLYLFRMFQQLSRTSSLKNSCHLSNLLWMHFRVIKAPPQQKDLLHPLTHHQNKMNLRNLQNSLQSLLKRLSLTHFKVLNLVEMLKIPNHQLLIQHLLSRTKLMNQCSTHSHPL
jgi:hypothetical protein